MDDEQDDDVQRMIREFRASVSRALSAHDERFDGLEGRMDGLEGRMDGLEGRMGGLEDRVTELTDEFRTRTRTMETAILNSIRDLSQNFGRRMDGLEAVVHAHLDEHRRGEA